MKYASHKLNWKNIITRSQETFSRLDPLQSWQIWGSWVGGGAKRVPSEGGQGWAEVGRGYSGTSASDSEPAGCSLRTFDISSKNGSVSYKAFVFCANDGQESCVPFWSAPASRLPNRDGTALPQIRRLGKTRWCCLLRGSCFICLRTKRTNSASGWCCIPMLSSQVLCGIRQGCLLSALLLFAIVIEPR